MRGWPVEVIVVSGALVFVALVLLVIGITTTGLGLVYASIAVSVVSGVLLVVAVLRYRTPPPPVALAGPAGEVPTAELTDLAQETVTAGPTPPAPPPLPVPAPAVDDEPGPPAGATGSGATGGGRVTVVSGRPRYHRADCRYVAGTPEAEELAVAEARELGFTPCGVCRPDEPGPPAGRRPTALVPAAEVVVVSGRPRFHRADCRYVREDPQAQPLGRAEAVQLGFVACGSCRP